MNKKYLHVITNINLGEFMSSLDDGQQKKLCSESPFDIYSLFSSDPKMFSYLSLIKNSGEMESEVIGILKSNSEYFSSKVIEILDKPIPRENPFGQGEKAYLDQINAAMSSSMNKFSVFNFYEEESHLCYLRFDGPESMKLSKNIKERDIANGISIVSRHKLEIVKMVNMITLMGLKESKDLVDNSFHGDPQCARYEIPLELTKTEIHKVAKILDTQKWTVQITCQFDGIDILRNKRINQIINE